MLYEDDVNTPSVYSCLQSNCRKHYMHLLFRVCIYLNDTQMLHDRQHDHHKYTYKTTQVCCIPVVAFVIHAVAALCFYLPANPIIVMPLSVCAFGTERRHLGVHFAHSLKHIHMGRHHDDDEQRPQRYAHNCGTNMRDSIQALQRALEVSD